MIKYMFAIAAFLPSVALGADYIEGTSTHMHQRICKSEQSGAVYCIQAPPLEKLTTDCDPGVDCHHMQSGQHYSVQRPVIVD